MTTLDRPKLEADLRKQLEAARQTIDSGGRDEFDPRELPFVLEAALDALSSIPEQGVGVDRAIEELCMLGENAFRADPKRSFGAIAEAVYLLRNLAPSQPAAVAVTAEMVEVRKAAIKECADLIDGLTGYTGEGTEDRNDGFAMFARGVRFAKCEFAKRAAALVDRDRVK
jgi:hypothetical protein